MRKFVKICGIAALVIVMAGTAGTLLGKYSKEPIESSLEVSLEVTEWAKGLKDSDVWKRIADFWKDGLAWGSKEPEPDGQGQAGEDDPGFSGYDIEDTLMFDSRYEIREGDVAKFRIAAVRIEDLSIEVSGCDFEIAASEDGEFYLEAKNVKKLQAFQEEGVLYVKGIHTVWPQQGNCEVTLYVPENLEYRVWELSLGAGMMRGKTLAAQSIRLNMDAGEFKAERLLAEEVTVEVGAGSVELSGVEVGRLTAQIGAGNLSVSGEIREGAQLTCNMGGAQLRLAGKREDYDYELRCVLGRIEIDGLAYHGTEGGDEDKDSGKEGQESGGRAAQGILDALDRIGEKTTVSNGTGRLLRLDCAVGSMEVEFTG